MVKTLAIDIDFNARHFTLVFNRQGHRNVTGNCQHFDRKQKGIAGYQHFPNHFFLKQVQFM